MATNVSASLLQLIRQQSGDHTAKGSFKAGDNIKGSLKRARAKSVTWAMPERMHQVCLFAAEDAPALLGLVSQDLLEAKKVKLLRASSTIDVHPASGNAATKRTKLEIAAILAMDAQLNWKPPERFLYNPSWLVAAGVDSLEVTVQQHREVRVLEAFYPRNSAIPVSPIEPPKAEPEVDNSNPRQIPLISCEDEEDIKSGDIRSISSSTISSAASARLAPQINSDPDVAAAAAAAFAVLKAQERGASIDRDLLIKILSNPLLTECLKNSNIRLSSLLNSNVPNNRIGGDVENGKGREQLSSQTTNAQGRGTHASPEEKGVLQWRQGNSMWPPMGFNVGANSGLSHGRGLHSYEQDKGILGNGKGAFGINTFMEQLCQDASKKLFPHSHVRCIPTNETLRQSPFLYEGMAARNNFVGLNCPPLLEGSLSAPFPRKSTAFRERMPAGTKVRKPCLFFNTAKGCRNGSRCNFLHESSQVEPSPVEKAANPPNAEELKSTKGDDEVFE